MARKLLHRRSFAGFGSVGLAALLSLIGAVTLIAADQPTPSQEQAPFPAVLAGRPEIAEMNESDRLLAEAYQKQDPKAADALHARGIGIVVKLYNHVHAQSPVDRQALSIVVEGLVARYGRWGTFRKSVSNFAGEELVWKELDEMLTDEFGQWHWRAVDARMAAKTAHYCNNAGVLDVLKLASTAAYVVRANTLQGEGHYREAIEQAELGVKSFSGLVGEESVEYFRAVRTLGELHVQQGHYAEGDEILQRALKLGESLFGTEHPEYAQTLYRIGTLYFMRTHYAKATPLFERCLAIYRATSGERTVEYATAVSALGACYNNTEKFDEAEKTLQQALQLIRESAGEKHHQYALATSNLGYLRQLQGKYDEAETLLRRSLEIFEELFGPKHTQTLFYVNTLANQLLISGKYAEAEALFHRVVDGRKELLGDQHPEYADALTRLGFLYRAQGSFAQAEPCFRTSTEIALKSWGRESVAYANCLCNIGSLHGSQGTYGEALRYFQEALEVFQRLNGEELDYGHTLCNIAATYNMQGKPLEAEPVIRRAVAIYEAKLGPNHPNLGRALGVAASIAHGLADDAEAERLSRRVVDIQLAAHGKQHVEYGRALLHLASAYSQRNEWSRAEPLLDQALQTYREAVGEQHPEYATALVYLATAYQNQNRLADAERLLLQAREVQIAKLGEGHPNAITGLSTLATVQFLQGRNDEARTNYQKAYDLARTNFGDDSEIAARYLNGLARIEHSLGDFAAAEPHCRAALEATLAWIERTMEAQSERRQLALAASQAWYLDTYLSIAADSGKFAEGAYRNALRRKGITWMQQRRLRAVADDPQSAPLFAELQTTASKLAQQAMTEPTPELRDIWRREVDDLARKKEDLEQQLAARSEAYRQSKQSVTLEDLTASLPADAALIDFVEYAHYRKPGPNGRQNLTERRFAAFVVRKNRPVELIGLGAADGAVAAIDRWREAYGIGPDGVAAGRQLREQLWSPLEPRLDGVKFVIVSPDGALGRLPLAALPGRKPDDYLVEDWALTTVAVPQALPSLLKDDAEATPAPSGNLLLVGGIDYDAVAGAPQLAEAPKKQFGRRPTRGADWKGFEPLAGTVGEIAVIEKTYRDFFGDEGLTTLEKGAAVEERFTVEAPNHLYLHIATHGFFAPPSLRTAIAAAPTTVAADAFDPGDSRSLAAAPMLVGLHPGLLSGLALAGANRPPAEDRADGILTAEEVQTLDLRRVELATLSACETGLGEVAGGEGLLGLQRSFQVAGVRTTVSSLWKVDDVQTRALMERFYRNLWEKELTKLEALREAQLWMLREGPRRDVRLRPTDLNPVAELKKSPPFYWAAFLLSGDWR